MKTLKALILASLASATQAQSPLVPIEPLRLEGRWGFMNDGLERDVMRYRDHAFHQAYDLVEVTRDEVTQAKCTDVSLLRESIYHVDCGMRLGAGDSRPLVDIRGFYEDGKLTPYVVGVLVPNHAELQWVNGKTGPVVHVVYDAMRFHTYKDPKVLEQMKKLVTSLAQEKSLLNKINKQVDNQ